MTNDQKRSNTEAGSSKPGDSGVRRGYVYLLGGVAAIGGFLFGYDTGVISGALLFLRPQFNLSPAMLGVVTSTILAGALIGAITSGTLNDRFGRRVMLICSAVLFAIGAIVTAVAPSISWLIAGRFVIGYGIGVASYSSPLYISESSPAGVRGALVSLSQLFITVGIVVAYVANYVFAYPDGWRWMFGLAIVPAGALAVGMALLPDSPRSLFHRGYKDEAKRLLVRLVGEQESVKILPSMLTREKGTWRELFRSELRHPLIIGLGLAVFQQFVGINTVIYYAPIIFQNAGFASATAAILATIGVGIANVAMTVVAMILLDRAGRKPLLYVGISGMVVTLAVLGAAFLRPPPERGPLALTSLTCYVAAFAISLGPIFWLMIAEIYPLRIRGRAMSLATFANWAANWIVTLTFPLLIDGIGESITFWIYAAMGVAALLFCHALVPETKGRTLEEIEAEWREPNTRRRL